MSKKIAPMLSWLIRNEWNTSWCPRDDLPEGMRDVEVWDAAEDEVKALLAVWSAAKRLDRAMDNRNGADSLWSIEDERESNKRALARLDRVSSRPGRGRKG